MMRMQSGLLCALAASFAFAISCADSSTGEEGDDMGSDDVSTNTCGDSVCAAAEVGYCMADCGMGGNNNAAQCGDGMCETTKGESATSCAVDCGGGSGTGSGSGSGSSTSCPADQTECFLCLLDPALCLPPLDEATCLSCLGLGGGGGGFGDIGCDGGAPDGTCNAATEDNSICPTDCP